MSSKETILADLRRIKMDPTDPPEPMMVGETPDLAVLRKRFAEVLEAVGGKCIVVRDVDELRRRLDEIEPFAKAEKFCSRFDPVASRGVDIESIDDPHQLADVDTALVAAQFGVAENGAVWLTDETLKHRALLFPVQYLAIVLPADELVPHMHAAYDRIELPRDRFGLFLSGPSKTADIEQSLVIGAHGPRGLTVFLLERM